MFSAVTEVAQRLELWLSRTFGGPYHVLLSVGIGIEILEHCRELPEKLEAAGIIKDVLAIVLFLSLLVHQAAELSEHTERRRERAGQRD